MADHAQNTTTQLEHLRLFHDAARALTSSLDLPTILRSILEQMERFFRPESWFLLMVDEQKRDAWMQSHSRDLPDTDDDNHADLKSFLSELDD